MTGAGPRRPAREVELDDIIWEGVLGGADDALDVLLKTHLALEALLIEMIALSQTKDDYLRWSFPKKTEFLKSTNHIGLSDKQAFDKINDARNDATHILVIKLVCLMPFCWHANWKGLVSIFQIQWVTIPKNKQLSTTMGYAV